MEDLVILKTKVNVKAFTVSTRTPFHHTVHCAFIEQLSVFLQVFKGVSLVRRVLQSAVKSVKLFT